MAVEVPVVHQSHQKFLIFFFSSPVQLGLRSWSSSLPDTIGAIKTLFTGGDQASTGQQRQIADLIAASCPTPPSLSLSAPPTNTTNPVIFIFGVGGLGGGGGGGIQRGVSSFPATDRPRLTAQQCRPITMTSDGHRFRVVGLFQIVVFL